MRGGVNVKCNPANSYETFNSKPKMSTSLGTNIRARGSVGFLNHIPFHPVVETFSQDQLGGTTD